MRSASLTYRRPPAASHARTAVLAAGGHTAGTGAARIRHDQADLIAYGQLFIANPDLPARFRLNAPLARPLRVTFYGGGAAGYTDYPAIDQQQTRQACPLGNTGQ